MSSSASSGNPARRVLPALLVALLPFICGGWLDGPQSTFDTKGPVAESQLQVFYVTLWVTGILFVIVAAVLAYATLKFKARSSDDEHAEPPPQGHGNPFVEIGLIVGSILALVVIAVPTLKAIWFTYEVPEEERADAYQITATGYQWWFKFTYEDEMTPQPFGGEAPLVTANELVIPAGRAVHIELRTVDVIHSFWVPKLAGKVDMMPNRGNHLWLKADEPGYFWGQCAEYCGESHAVMRFRVIALAEDDFNNWLTNQKLPAREVAVPEGATAPTTFASYGEFEVNQPGWTEEFDADPFGRWQAQQIPAADEDPALIAAGRQYFMENRCAGCHTVRGHDGMGVIGPDLTRIGSRTTVAAGLLENSPENLYRWITEPNHVKPGNFMYNTRKVTPGGMVVMPGYVMNDPETGDPITDIEITPEEAHALVAYLHSLK
ncbi:cytochrome c oxidase subunit II [Synoicihabitans lomoniglobus]|uniref:cytochrome-c oxidase n=1 Tax=Synoicihabitans lomoniglobus TaxID=2909285 RepID=A0AAE9ZXM9_9BACT|nr:cytochrome c oxidase subunit II [Opitutaceae bacterium LMO-M01]WED63088.1 cytochrome c oxidase subunit II [Opitutaceae bacterium LMO-M01]